MMELSNTQDFRTIGFDNWDERMPKNSVGIQTHKSLSRDGKVQTFCGIEINDTETSLHIGDKAAALDNWTDDICRVSIGFQTDKFLCADGKVQTFCGLILNDSVPGSSVHLHDNPIKVCPGNVITPDGKLQTYWCLRLTNKSNTPVSKEQEGFTSLEKTSKKQHNEANVVQRTRKRKAMGIAGPVSKKTVTRSRRAIQSNKAGTSRGKKKTDKSKVVMRMRKQTDTIEGTKHSAIKRTRKRSAYMSTGVDVPYLDFGHPSCICANCGAYMWYEERSKNKDASSATTFSSCCQGGKILLPQFLDAPEPLKRLLDYNDVSATKFKDDIRTYNSMFCFTSFGGKIDHALNKGRGLYTFRISGQNYHRFGSMLPVEGAQPRYAQLYFYDTENEMRNRMAVFKEREADKIRIEETIVSGLMEMLDKHSSVAKAFRMARDWCAENQNNNCELRLLGQRTSTRQYNKPNVSEIAVLITNDFGDSTEPRDIIVSTKAGGLKRISELHQLYMALQYPLLFPYGETGYHESIPYHANTGRRKTKRECLTMREYYCYRIHHRQNEGTTLLRGGRLYQQYLVDAYTAIEEERLRWMRNNQSELRADLYNNVCDAVTRGDTNAEAIGQRIVLPATFTGSPRYMVQNYQDAMALCRAFGNPELFITFTANPKWPEIDNMVSLIPGQKSHDRAETVSRVFKMKLNVMIEDIMKKKIFGKTKAGVYTIEFQKRGLPHAHILIWLEEDSRCITPSDIDDLISAEIPSEADDPRLYKAVTEYMLHGPCGSDSPVAPCTIDEKCTKHFPKPFYQETTIDEDGYPVYRRRKNNVFVVKNKTQLHNGFVVPYNRYLLLKYDAHINVEWCNRSRAIKYLFKYLNKGPDRATMIIHENVKTDGAESSQKIIKVDEITNFLDCRYLSPCEAVWRMFAFPIHYSYPSVIRLTFHLPDQHMITVRDSEDLSTLLDRERIKETMFTKWLELNEKDPRARDLTYSQIPTKYVWQGDNKNWVWRGRRTSIGRIVYCNPAAGPRYYLRVLLSVVRGPKSFEEIRTVNGHKYQTFKEACYAHGLLNDDKEWTHALNEAKFWATGSQLRELFVTMLLFCDVTSPRQLWEENWEILAEDILYKKRKQFSFPELQLSDEQRQNYCLVEIQEVLGRNGKSLEDFSDLPTPDSALLTTLDNRLIREELSYNQALETIEHQRLYQSLNPDQQSIYNDVITSVDEHKGKFYFVYGAGGTGKTFLYKAILSRLRSQGMIALAVASSGIASLLLPGGRTAHSRFVIPLELLENSTCGIKQNTHLAALMQEVKLIIWDEAPMTQRFAFEALDKTLRDILGFKEPKNRDRIFGGLTVMLGGDFRQILPVIPKGKRQEVVDSCINKSVLWKSCEVFILTRNMRVNEYSPSGIVDLEKQKFNKWVLDVGDGIVESKAKEEEDEATWIKIPDNFIVPYSTSPIEAIVNATFPNFDENQENEEYLRERAILTPKNVTVDDINDFMFKKLDRPSKIYLSSDEICRASTDSLEQENLYPIEFLNSLNFPGIPPHLLEIKEGLPVMLLRNINPSQGLCNGTRLIVTDLGRFVIKARIITGSRIGRTALIPRITLTSTTSSKWPFIMKRRQFPIKPCYAMTINKSQGQSLKKVGLYLPNPVFSHGQLYVAMSRVTHPDGFKLLMVQDTDSAFKNHTRNIVYREAFNNIHVLS